MAAARVPTAAILENSYVLVLGEDGVIERRDIRIGVANWKTTEVLDGLTACGLELGPLVRVGHTVQQLRRVGLAEDLAQPEVLGPDVGEARRAQRSDDRRPQLPCPVDGVELDLDERVIGCPRVLPHTSPCRGRILVGDQGFRKEEGRFSCRAFRTSPACTHSGRTSTARPPRPGSRSSVSLRRTASAA